jgi:(p)ppGpp synthase/HD superfamily hydrolase
MKEGKKMKMILRAAKLAKKAHEGQLDKGGNPYFLHPLAVARLVRKLGPEYVQVALLHDVVEDTDVMLQDLLDAGFDEHVVMSVDAMSRRDGESNRIYYARVMADPVAIRVKMADLTHNMDPSRVPGSAESPEWQRKYKWMAGLKKDLQKAFKTDVPHWGGKERPDLRQVAEIAGGLI